MKPCIGAIVLLQDPKQEYLFMIVLRILCSIPKLDFFGGGGGYMKLCTVFCYFNLQERHHRVFFILYGQQS